MVHRGQAFLESRGESVRAVGDGLFADVQVPFKGLGQRPSMLEGMVAAGRHRGSGGETCLGRRHPVQPGLIAATVEGRNDRPCAAPSPSTAPHDARSARPPEPFVSPGHQEIASEIRNSLRLDAEAVNAVDAQKNSVAPVPAGVETLHHACNTADGKLETRARMHPGKRDHARARRYRRANPADNLLGRDSRKISIQADLADSNAVAYRPQSQ